MNYNKPKQPYYFGNALLGLAIAALATIVYFINQFFN